MANPITRHIPNTVTLLNLLCGCLALICAFRPFDEIAGLYGYQATFILILAGALADFMDGLFARLLKAHSPLGADLDSLSDLVTFGVAPAMLIYNLLSASPAEQWIRWSCMLIPICGALRLARFNVDSTQATVFRGLPIPACALFCIGLADIMMSQTGFNQWAAAGSVLLIALAMVSPIRMISLKFKSLRPTGVNVARYFLIACAAVFVAIWHWTGLYATICAYVLISFGLNLSQAARQCDSSEN